MGAEKSGVGAVSIRRREAVGLGHGDIRTKPISILGTERQQTVQSHVSGVLAVVNDSWTLRACCAKASLLANKMRTH